jgi:hypothetical protein
MTKRMTKLRQGFHRCRCGFLVRQAYGGRDGGQDDGQAMVPPGPVKQAMGSVRYTAGDSILHSGIFSRVSDVFNRFICHLLTLFRTFWNPPTRKATVGLPAFENRGKTEAQAHKMLAKSWSVCRIVCNSSCRG